MTTELPDFELTPNEQFGQRLRRIRDAAGLQVKQMAEAINLDSTLATRYERGERWAPQDVVEKYAATVGLDPDGTKELIEYRAECKELEVKLRNVVENARVAQYSRSKYFDGANLIQTFTATSIPFYLQGAEYARQQLGVGADTQDIIDQRRTARDAVGGGGKGFRILLSEAALWLRPCDPTAMRQQLNELHGYINATRVDFGIIPFAVQQPILPRSDFTIFDKITLVESFAGAASLTPKKAPGYVVLLNRLGEQAVRGKDARALLDAAASALPAS